MENADFLVIRLKGSGLTPAFLLDIDLRYSYIQPNQKANFCPLLSRGTVFVERSSLLILLFFKQTCHSEESRIAFGRSKDVTI